MRELASTWRPPAGSGTCRVFIIAQSLTVRLPPFTIVPTTSCGGGWLRPVASLHHAIGHFVRLGGPLDAGLLRWEEPVKPTEKGRGCPLGTSCIFIARPVLPRSSPSVLVRVRTERVLVGALSHGLTPDHYYQESPNKPTGTPLTRHEMPPLAGPHRRRPGRNGAITSPPLVPTPAGT